MPDLPEPAATPRFVDRTRPRGRLGRSLLFPALWLVLGAALGGAVYQTITPEDDRLPPADGLPAPGSSPSLRPMIAASGDGERPGEIDTPEVVAFENARSSELGGAAVGLIDFDWQNRLPGWTVSFTDRDDAVAGYTWTREKHIEVFVREDSTPESLARVFAHELGHAVDVEHNTPEERRAWLQVRDATGSPWWPASGHADFETGAGDFAEVTAWWLVGGDDFRSRIEGPPDADDLELFLELFLE